MKKVSVVIPVYNSEKYIRQCMDSLVTQSYRELEIICVNDGSTDSSQEILEQYSNADNRIIALNRKNDGKGAAEARNMGLNESGGEYIIFLDSDDFFETDMISSMVERAESVDADVVLCGADRFDDMTGRISGLYRSIHLDQTPKKDWFSWKDCSEKIYQIGDTITWNKLYRRGLLIDNDLHFEAIPISDDQYVPALALILAKRIAVVDRCFVHYRCNIGTSQVDKYAGHPSSAYLASYSIVSKLREYGVFEDVKRSYLNTAVRLLRDYYDKLDNYTDYIKQHEYYLSDVLPFYEASDLPVGYFYDDKLDQWYQMIKEKSPGEILFEVARAYSNDTTRILREKDKN